MVSRMTVGILRLLKREPQPRTRKARPGAVSKEQIILMMGLSAVKEGTIVPTAATALKTGQSIVACRLMSRDRPTKAAMNSSAVKATKVRKSALFAVAEETKKPLALNHAKRSANPTIRAPSIAMGPFFRGRVVLSAVMLILPLYLSYTHTFISGAFWDKQRVRYDHGAWLSSYYFASVGMTPARYS